MLSASEQLVELNEKLAVQKIAVTEKTESCEKLLAEIAQRTGIATEKKQLALGKKKEIAEQNVQIVKEKVTKLPCDLTVLVWAFVMLDFFIKV